MLLATVKLAMIAAALSEKGASTLHHAASVMFPWHGVAGWCAWVMAPTAKKNNTRNNILPGL
jgi:hypothetical protein